MPAHGRSAFRVLVRRCRSTPSGLIRRAAGLGLGLVQIADNLPLEDLRAEEIAQSDAPPCPRELPWKLATRGIAPARLRRMFELCGVFDCRLLRVVVDTADHHPSPAEVTRAHR